MGFLKRLKAPNQKRSVGAKRIIENSVLFDARYYAIHSPGVEESDAVKHYLETGWREGRDPSPYFSTAWYLAASPDVAAEGVCPLLHFLKHGLSERRSTSPFFRAEQMAKTMVRGPETGHPLLAYLDDWKRQPWPEVTLFDIGFFLSHLSQEGSADEREPFARYMADGVKLGSDPHPLFSTTFYLDQNPEVRAANANPLRHFMMQGGLALRDPHPMFDSRFYVQQNSQLTLDMIGIPLLHYLTIGASRGLDPNEEFSTSYYSSQYSDLRTHGINPLVHYVQHGQKEGRRTRPSRRRVPAREAAITLGPKHEIDDSLLPLSVVIPTYNRVDTLKNTLDACEKYRGGVKLEYVVVDDGSTDGTYDFISQLSFPESAVVPVRTKNNGPGPARNKGVQVASNDVILFIGDDIRPLNDDFFRAHSNFHQQRLDLGDAMLGKIVWPGSDLLSNNFVMQHVQGRSGEQFGFADMIPYEYYDWRFFYTSNVSIKRAVIGNWDTDGFSDHFRLYGFEDAELAYRLSQGKASLSLFYDPMSIASHFHPYSFDGFVNRQLNAGRMANVFVQRHPGIGSALGLSSLDVALKSQTTNHAADAADSLAIFEGLRAWISIQERRGDLGNSGYHKDLLSAFFEYSFALGYLNAAGGPCDNVSEASVFALNTFLQRMRRSISTEIAKDFQII